MAVTGFSQTEMTNHESSNRPCHLVLASSPGDHLTIILKDMIRVVSDLILHLVANIHEVSLHGTGHGSIDFEHLPAAVQRHQIVAIALKATDRLHLSTAHAGPATDPQLG